uniref:Uncharacterized protein n=1 Tax=Siphoviridae sp. ctJYR23 TaxID=2827837 RepID=A0A8S5SL22_9CAUD|nr:MAG TPA: hypothetical protein [Siphoviridae sp. ctJYR23]
MPLHSPPLASLQPTYRQHTANTPKTSCKPLLHNTSHLILSLIASPKAVLSQHPKTPYFCRIFVVNKLVVSKRQHSNG